MLSLRRRHGRNSPILAAQPGEPRHETEVHPAFALRGVEHQYGDRHVLAGIDLQMDEFRVGAIGANGSGKSTFARLLNGLVLPTQGRVLVDGLDTRRDVKGVRRRVGFVFQDPDAQIIYPTVEEDVAFGLRNQGLPRDEVACRVAEELRRYGLYEYREHPAHLLSGGQKQMLAIVSVLVMRPRYIVLDEPTTLLDLRNKRRVADAIGALDQKVVVVTHDLDLLASFERVLVFRDGRIVGDDSPGASIKQYVRLVT